MVALDKVSHYTNGIIHKAININSCIIIKKKIHVSSSRNKGATDKPGLDHHPHNSAMDRILHNPQHG
jgi:hypothetical protein